VNGARSSPGAPRFRTARLLLVLGLGAVMAFLALRSSPYLQYIPWMPRRLGVWADHHGILRNTVAFAGFALVVHLLLGCRAWLVATLCAFGALIEIVQLWIPGRTFDWKDIVASVAGVLIAWPFAWAGRRLMALRSC